MADIKRDGSVNPGEIIVPDGVAEFIRGIVTRREFLQVSGAVGLGAATFSLIGCGSSYHSGCNTPAGFRGQFAGHDRRRAEPLRGMPALRAGMLRVQRRQVDAVDLPHQGRPELQRRPVRSVVGDRPAGRHLGEPSHRAGRLPPVSAPGALSAGVPSRRHRSRAPDQREGRRRSKMRRLRHLHESLSMGDDIPERAGRWRDYQGDQMLPLPVVRERLSGGGPEICGLARPDEVVPAASGGSRIHPTGGGCKGYLQQVSLTKGYRNISAIKGGR